MKTRAQMIVEVGLRVPTEVYPQLRQDHLESAVDASQRYALHAVSTTYAAHDRVIPSPPNGRSYRCLTPGQTGATAPAWPDARRARLGEIVTDGAVVWEDCGPSMSERYDLSLAIREAWLMKAAIASADADTSDGTLRVQASQVAANCRETASRYGARGIW